MNTLYPAQWLSLGGDRDTEIAERYGQAVRTSVKNLFWKIKK